MKPVLLIGVILAITAVLVIAGVYIPYKAFPGEIFIDLPKGTTTRDMAQRLSKEGVIRYPWQFLVMRLTRPNSTLQAGEYRFENAASAAQVFDRISRGDVYYHEITVPEGSNIFDITSIVDQSGLIKGTTFLRAAANSRMIADLDPQAMTLEGYLFPSTYRITRATTAEQLVRQMVDQFRKQWKALAPAGENAHNAVTLASLVEKETGVPAERATVASVYANRLRIGMKLDCDPTTIYAALLDDRYRGVIHRSDLASRNAYNTYQHAGLPPGPIANPGVASLKAALAPASTDYLYFVAKGDGSGAHRFSSDFSAHEKAVQAYRRAHSKAEAR